GEQRIEGWSPARLGGASGGSLSGGSCVSRSLDSGAVASFRGAPGSLERPEEADVPLTLEPHHAPGEARVPWRERGVLRVLRGEHASPHGGLPRRLRRNARDEGAAPLCELVLHVLLRVRSAGAPPRAAAVGEAHQRDARRALFGLSPAD